MKLGDKVKFERYYRKNANFVDYEKLTNEQAKELDETDQIVLERLDTVDLEKPLIGFVAGKRGMVKTTILGYGQSRFNPDGEETFYSINSSSVEVYLVAARMDRMYKVPAEWLEVIQ